MSDEQLTYEGYYVEDDFLDALALKHAVWQYLLDHSRLTPEGLFRITFFTKNQQQFWGHVKAREYGKYKRDNLQTLYQRQAQQTAFFLKHERKREEFSRHCSAIDASGSWLEKLALFLYRRTRDYLTSRISRV